MRDDYAVASRGGDWHNFDVVMDVVGLAVQRQWAILAVVDEDLHLWAR
jgi:hypothetical protein